MSDIEKKKGDVVISPQISRFSEFDTGEHNVFVVQEEGPDFRGVTCFGAAVLIAKAQFGLGVLGIPQTFVALGIVPGLICLLALCALSTWTGYIVGQFRLNHPQVYSIGDAAEIMFGKVGREVMGGAFWLYYALVYGASLLTLSIAFNTLSEHAVCTTVWVAIGAVVTFVLGTLIRTMKVMSWCGYIALASVFISSWIVAIACLTQDTPDAAPKTGPIDKAIAAVATGQPFSVIASAIGVQLLSLCGTAAYFNIHSEMRDQKQYNKSLFMGQGFVIVNYIILACMIYGKVGVYVTSPALGSAGPLFQKIGYGVALPGLLFSCFFHAHLAGKYGLVRILRGTQHLQKNTFTHWFTWLSMMTIVILFGFVIASAIPFFNELLALMASLIGSSFTLILPGFLASYQMSKYFRVEGDSTLAWMSNLKQRWNKTLSNKITSAVAVLAIVLGIFILGAGTYGAVQSIIDNYNNGVVSGAFSCDDNS
ncbi:hypothetical protein FT663_02924 [Candidozyma haemuli var. vulneris]|uniref:Amino acid transporter transmembrane domain-containing protein n=1 Tax=Candidozyma haemuli TaxID=45357 RepID=A0A2V1AXV4_9ASCO|nr:hypothetical protein CXQ85_005374 [[Candida] haemuloni]KAF3987335.1 hypothetical protein FT662_04066 [[Candida] haemuloni var. vulneris]KAF3990958.1 hypothetical protein FT663_02924 [[Candida] haemuloni var. vulneris]PVH22346.1 hypothetical protein CXQ85_005374 [[Candida] haemuloni]